jgi:TolB protein
MIMWRRLGAEWQGDRFHLGPCGNTAAVYYERRRDRRTQDNVRGSYNASPNWSPRGDRIVFVSQVRGLFKIATTNPDGSDFRMLTNGRGNDENPMWSPNGRQIVFSSNREGKFNIYIMNADGTDIERITPNDANYTSPAWSP